MRLHIITSLYFLCGCSLHFGSDSEPGQLKGAELSQLREAQASLGSLDVNSVIRSAPSPKLPEPELPITREVVRELEDYLRGDSRFVRQALARREKHLTLLRGIFVDEGVPQDLINLALIESGFRNDARSEAGAVGLWQFTKQTARNYGLTVSPSNDQRKDVILSTVAAARHLKDLYLELGDWNLVLAAYNAGTGAVIKARKRSRSDNYWDMVRARSFSTQTSRFVPRFVAASLIVKTIDEHGPEDVNKRVMALINGNDRSEEIPNRAGSRRSSFG